MFGTVFGGLETVLEAVSGYEERWCWTMCRKSTGMLGTVNGARYSQVMLEIGRSNRGTVNGASNHVSTLGPRLMSNKKTGGAKIMLSGRLSSRESTSVAVAAVGLDDSTPPLRPVLAITAAR